MAKILVVDDSKFMRLTLKNMLEKGGGHTVIGEAGSDVEAVIQYQKLQPELVTMDIIMPLESGLSAVKEIMKADPKARIIMVSAMGQEKIMEESQQLGAKGFVEKPVTQQALLDAINKAML
ncbi:MAG: response regulator [Elusimicrobia bacterium]|nr:response regulator [Candidatus Liberimonas magnetica]